MAGTLDASLSAGATAPTILPVLKTFFEDGMEVDVNLACDALKYFMRRGTKRMTSHQTQKFAIKGNIGQTLRSYKNAPCSGFAVCSQPPEWCDVDLGFKRLYTPTQICHDVLTDGRGGAMFDTWRENLRDLADQQGHYLERSIFTGDGKNILFTLADTGTAGSGTTYIYQVQWYGGVEGEELGDLMDALLLRNLQVHVADLVGPGATLRTSSHADNAVQIVAVDPTPGAETITTDVQIVGAAIGDVVYPSRQDVSGLPAVDDGVTGFPLLGDDFTLAATFQGLTAAECPSFAGQVCGAGGIKRPMTEMLAEQALAKAFVRKGRRKSEKMTFSDYAFFGHEATIRKFGLSMTEGRRFTSPLVGAEGMKAYGGVVRDTISFEGIPMVGSHLGFKNRLHLVPLKDTVIVHNGPVEGQFLAAPNGPYIERVGCTPVFEIVWVALLDFAVRSRNGFVTITDLESFSDC